MRDWGAAGDFALEARSTIGAADCDFTWVLEAKVHGKR